MPLDIGVGLILGVLLSNVTDLSYSVSLIIGVISALLPDADYVYSAIRSKNLPNSKHRDGLHYPLITVPVVGLIGWIIDPNIGLILALGSLLHFIHDSVGVGFGVKWLFPFKKNSYLFLFQIKTPNNKNMPKKLLYSWNDKERDEMIKKYGYPGWIRFVYFRPNAWGLFEYTTMLVGIYVAIVNAN